VKRVDPQGDHVNTPRTVLELGTGWRYREGEIRGAHAVDLDDDEWPVIALPHSTGFNTPEDADERLGVSWYRTRVITRPDWTGKRIQLRFEAVMQSAVVWVNGVRAAEHSGGYTPFATDITDLLTPDDINLIAVRADSRPNPDFAPGRTGVDFRYFGGIYRDVTLTITDPVHITDSIAADTVAGGGVFITTPRVSAEAAKVRIRTHVANESIEEVSVQAAVVVRDPGGTVIAREDGAITLGALSAGTLEQDFHILGPQLWHPHHPSLYSAEVTLRARDEAILDQVAERFGIRRIEWSRHGLFINGDRLRAIGVNRHQETYALGNAVPVDAIRRDVRRVKEAGFDFIRTSHYPNHPAFYDACDEFGVLVLNSLTGWQAFHATPEFVESTGRELREMIRRDRNHPSIVAWETSLNETDYPAEWAQTMHTIGHEEYPGDQMFTAGWKDHFDIFLGASQHGVRDSANRKPVIISEWGDWDYGGNESSSRVARESYDLPTLGGNALQQVANHQEGLGANLALTWFTADALWDFADISGYNPTASLMGVVDYYRIPKFSYYFFASQRDPHIRIAGVETGPMVHIANTWSPGSPTRVTVFSNADRVRLFKNGCFVAQQSPDTKATSTLPHPPFTFDVGEFEPGTLRAQALIGAQVVAQTERSTARAAAAIRLTLDSLLPLHPGRADARLIFIEVIDDRGTTVYQDGSTVIFAVDGPGKLVGPHAVTMKGGMLAIWIQTTGAEGAIAVTASAPNLAPATIMVEASDARRDDVPAPLLQEWTAPIRA
jgi:hypothetical protein